MDKLGMAHICFLVMIQWISLATVVLNGVALSLAQKDPQLDRHLVSTIQSGPQDILLIITGILSFLAATFPLCLHLRLSCRPSHRSPFVPTAKKILIGELTISVVMVTFITATSSIVSTQFHVASNCQLDVYKRTSPCQMLEMAITLGIATAASWVILLIIASINMIQLPIMSAPEFILEANPYIFSHYALNEDKKISLSADTGVAAVAPPYTPLSPQLPPPSFSSVVTPLRHSHQMIDVHPPPPSSSMDYFPDIKYPTYSIDSLPTIQSGTSKFDLSFLHL